VTGTPAWPLQFAGAVDSPYSLTMGAVLRYRPIPLTRVGIDVIDGWLSKVDVTSPTGLRQLVDPTGTRPDPAVIAWLEERAGSGVG